MLTFKQFLVEIKLVVSRKLPSGRIKYGRRGWIHSDLLTQKEMNSKNVDTSGMGFSEYPKGKWMSRKQSFKFLQKHNPENIKKRKIITFHSSDIKDHNKIRDD